MDNSGLILNLYDKQGNLRAQGNVGENSVEIKGLNPGDKVQAGDYQVAFADIYGNVSERVDVPAFTVNASGVGVVSHVALPTASTPKGDGTGK